MKELPWQAYAAIILGILVISFVVFATTVATIEARQCKKIGSTTLEVYDIDETGRHFVKFLPGETAYQCGENVKWVRG